MRAVVAWLELGTAGVFLLLMIRIGYVFSANPIGELTTELMYLRVSDLKAPLSLMFFALLLQVGLFVYPAFVLFGWVQAHAEIDFYTNAVQALLILSGSMILFFVLQRYTHRGLDRRIRSSMETLAYLAGQRRRRARARGEEENPRPADRRGRDFE